MVITYVVQCCESCGGGARVIESHRFSSVDEAIGFQESKSDGYFSWWEIKVEWQK